MHEYERMKPGDSVLWNGRRYLAKNIIRGTAGVMWYLSEIGSHNPGFGDAGPVAESELVPVMPQIDHDTLTSIQQNTLTARRTFLQAAKNGFESAAAALPSWMAILEHYHTVSTRLYERFPCDDFARSCREQAEAWMKE